MRIALAQLAPVVGDFEGNFERVREAYERARAAGVDLCVTPELGLCGYPPYDLVERPEMLERNARSLARAAALTAGGGPALLVGAITPNAARHGRGAQNCALAFEGGREVFRQAKTLLPTYDVFDESRYFEPAAEVRLWEFRGTKLAVAICEDLWAEDPEHPSLYGRDPVAEYARLGAGLVISLSASPYVWGKGATRERLHRAVVGRLGCPVLYVNQTGATDELLFDGGSFALDAGGRRVGRLAVFEPGFGVFALGSGGAISAGEGVDASDPPEEIEILARGLVVGIREYFERTGFKTAILGLSGGIDSAVVATLAVRALGPANVLGVAMPGPYSSSHALADAEDLSRRLGVRFEVQPIKFLFAAAHRELGQARGGSLRDVAQENLQSRLRGLVLMALSNHEGALVLTTGNKSEIATGYCTLYGDMCGALAPIGDLLKTRVYALARHLNAAWGDPIPGRTLDKPPSAELRPGQTDQDSLPPYDLLDAFLEGYLERGRPVAEFLGLEAKGGKAGWVAAMAALVEATEHKRRQAAPALKVSAKAFGIGRRVPIAKRWKSRDIDNSAERSDSPRK